MIGRRICGCADADADELIGFVRSPLRLRFELRLRALCSVGDVQGQARPQRSSVPALLVPQ